MQVGVRELKAHLSDYLSRAEQGDQIVVTERGRPKAVLGPLPGRVRLEQGLAEGWVVAGRRRGMPPQPRRHEATRRVLDVLAEDRGE